MPSPDLSRRRLLGGLGALALTGAPKAMQAAPAPRGLVLPRAAAPAFALLDSAGRPNNLAQLLRGRISCVQLMFAGCTTTCPVQGALFAALARQALPREVQLLSLTVDPLGDSPQALSRWLDRFGRVAYWQAAAPRPHDVQGLADYLRGAPARTGTHSTQAFLFDREARLAFRTVDMPAPDHLAGLLNQLARAASPA